MDTFGKKYGIKITNDNPDGSSAQENQAIRSLKGDSRAPDCVDVGVSFAIAGANEGLYAKYFPKNYKTIPRAMKDTRGFWMGDYWGAISIGYNQNLVSNPPKTWKDLLKPEYKGKVALNGSPLTSNSAVSGVIAAAMGNGGSASNVAARHRLLRAAEEERQLHPRADDACRRSRRARPRSRSTGTTTTSPTSRASPRRSGGSRSRRTASTAATTRRPSTRPLRIRGQPVSGRSSSTPTRVRSSGSRVRRTRRGSTTSPRARSSRQR